MTKNIIVQNLKCGGCANTIVQRISALDNISNVDVDVASSTITVEYKNENDIALVKQKLKDLGYPTSDTENSISSKAVSFFSCAVGKLSK